jgi:hypothetical protein
VLNVDGSIQTAPNPRSGIDWKPGKLLGCVSGELGLRNWLESNGYEFVVHLFVGIKSLENLGESRDL